MNLAKMEIYEKEELRNRNLESINHRHEEGASTSKSE